MGDVYVTGSQISGDNNQFYVIKVSLDGVIDTSFGSDGVVLAELEGDDVSNLIMQDHNGSLIIGGWTETNIGILKLYGDKNSSLPTLQPISSHVISHYPSSQNIPLIELSGISSGLDGSQPIRVQATSSIPSLIPYLTVTYTSPNTTGSVLFTQAFGPQTLGQNGAVNVTINC